MDRKWLVACCVVSLLTLGVANSADASLDEFMTFLGHVGYSADGFGAVTNSGIISASVPAGATVLNAYLYQAVYFTLDPSDATLNGNDVAFGPTVVNTSGGGFLGSKRADVTGIVKPVIDGGLGGIYGFDLVELGGAGDNVNGEALVVVYTHPALPVSSFAILDGFSAFGGDSTSINFADPLHPADPGFFAEMALGISHSCCGQASNVTVNGTLITENAGSFDDGLHLANGSLITVGGYDDPFSPLLPSYAGDHERYDLVPYITDGDTSIDIRTLNPSADDDIFLALFHVLGEAGFNEPPPTSEPVIPEPSSMLLLGSGLAFAGLKRIRRKS